VVCVTKSLSAGEPLALNSASVSFLFILPRFNGFGQDDRCAWLGGQNVASYSSFAHFLNQNIAPATVCVDLLPLDEEYVNPELLKVFKPSFAIDDEMSDVYIAMESAGTKSEFVQGVLARYADLIAQAHSVFVKPNIVSEEPYPTTTDPRVLDTVLTYLSGYKVSVTVGDGPAYDYSWRGEEGAVPQGHPLRRVCDAHGVKLVNLNQREHVKRELPYGLTLPLSVIPDSFDVKISLPVLKRHITCTVTGAVKNQFGLLDLSARSAMHRGTPDIHKGIAAIAAVERCNLFILDAVETLLVAEEVRHGGKKAFLGYMLAGTDPVALDSAGFDLLKRRDRSITDKSAPDILHLAYAADCGAGSLKHTLIDFWGE